MSFALRYEHTKALVQFIADPDEEHSLPSIFDSRVVKLGLARVEDIDNRRYRFGSR